MNSEPTHGVKSSGPRDVDELLTVDQAATILSIRPWTLRHWISDRRIDIVKYGNGSVRIRRSVLDRFVAHSTIRARRRDGHTGTT